MAGVEEAAMAAEMEGKAMVVAVAETGVAGAEIECGVQVVEKGRLEEC